MKWTVNKIGGRGGYGVGKSLRVPFSSVPVISPTTQPTEIPTLSLAMPVLQPSSLWRAKTDYVTPCRKNI